MIPLTGAEASPGMLELNVYSIGRIPWRNVVEFNPRGDQYQSDPHLFVRYADNGEPYDCFRYGYEESGTFVELRKEARVLATSDLTLGTAPINVAISR